MCKLIILNRYLYVWITLCHNKTQNLKFWKSCGEGLVLFKFDDNFYKYIVAKINQHRK